MEGTGQWHDLFLALSCKPLCHGFIWIIVSIWIFICVEPAYKVEFLRSEGLFGLGIFIKSGSPGLEMSVCFEVEFFKFTMPKSRQQLPEIYLVHLLGQDVEPACHSCHNLCGADRRTNA